jgi:hypothetical protein
VFKLPRITVLRSMIMNHSIHHRAQLGVYFQLNDMLVPAIYGPSADEEGCRESREPHGALAVCLMSALSVRMGWGADLRCWLDLLVPCLGPQKI